MILSLLAWFFTVKKNFRGDWLLSVMGLLTVSYIISSIVNWGNVPSEFVKSHTSVSKEIFSLATPFIWFFIVRSAPISWKKISFLLGSFATAVFANTLLQMVLNKAPYSLVANNRLSFYYNPNFSAGLIALSCLALLWMLFKYKNPSLRCIFTIMFLVNSAGLYFTFSRGAWLGLFITLLILIVYLSKKRIPLVATLILLALGTFFLIVPRLTLPQNVTTTIMHNNSQDVSNGRVEIWQTALNIVRDHPWFGVGPKMFKTFYTRTSHLTSSPNAIHHIHAHNNFLQVLVEAGVFGLLFFIFLDILLFWRICHLIKDSAKESPLRGLAIVLLGWLIIWNIHGLFDYTFGLKYYTTPLLFLLGLLLANPTHTAVAPSNVEQFNKA